MDTARNKKLGAMGVKVERPLTRKGANKYIKAVFDIDISSLDKDELLKLTGVLKQIT